ncbi:MAG: DinB family protein [Chitinophagaceae bacterium]|nr:DinB family protein [Chitinophagaceae bacterium]MBK8951920.1 DinB family protein [Chitinophagaceae bacterium]
MAISSSVSTRLHYQHKTITDIIDGLSDELIRRSLVNGKWSIFETIVHLQTYQHIFIERVKQILTGESPVFSPYTSEADPVFHENCTKSMREIMQDLLTTRKKMTAEMHTFPDADLTKKGTHPSLGTLTLAEWLHFFVLHEAHHLFAMFKLGAEIKKGL